MTFNASVDDARDTLKMILSKGRMSPLLKEAVSETVKAIDAGELRLAYQISACKSLVVGVLRFKDGSDYAFRESDRLNRKALGESVYALLDGVHFRLAMMLNELPSGMMACGRSPQGVVVQQMRHIGTHPIVERIKLETRLIVERSKENQA